MSTPDRSLRRPHGIALLFLALPLIAASCPRSFEYRAIQGDFIEAARIDNQAAVDPVFESSARASYARIAEELSAERIAELDPKLRPNAWVIRSLSLWRAGRYKEAIASADTGSRVEGLGPRDQVLLALVPALAVDSEAKDDWMAAGRELSSLEAYAPFQTSFEQAFAQIEKAEQLLGESAAPSTSHYVSYQRWRVLNDWRIVIASIDREAALSELRSAAKESAKSRVGKSLKDAAREAREAIPEPHPLHQLIIALEQG